MIEVDIKELILMKDKIVITIGRQFGSGGREIGKLIAEKLGINFYDKELISIAAKQSGLCEQIFETHDENQQLFIFPGYGYLFAGLWRYRIYGCPGWTESISCTV